MKTGGISLTIKFKVWAPSSSHWSSFVFVVYLWLESVHVASFKQATVKRNSDRSWYLVKRSDRWEQVGTTTLQAKCPHQRSRVLETNTATKSNQSTIKRSSSIMFRGYIKFKRKAPIIFKYKSIRHQARLPKALTVRNHLYYLALHFSWCWYSFDIWGMYLHVPGVFIRAYVLACG